MDSRASGNDGEGCRNDGEGAGNDGLLLWSPYPKLGLTGTFTSPYGKGWSARMAGHSRTLSTTCHSAPLGHGASHPHPLIRNWGFTMVTPRQADQPSDLAPFTQLSTSSSHYPSTTNKTIFGLPATFLGLVLLLGLGGNAALGNCVCDEQILGKEYCSQICETQRRYTERLSMQAN